MRQREEETVRIESETGRESVCEIERDIGRKCVCIWVKVQERESVKREREKERERERERETSVRNREM